MQCRAGCGACCIAPSIKRGFYGMPGGKPAGVCCVHLDEQMRCGLFGDPRRPGLCAAFRAEPAVCGDSPAQALRILDELEQMSKPDNG
ncbi:YkgJ family cysteine cluster protein [Seongchinamella sediminis]|uniref:YkgJ family cysteine cluster protein n=1 Tax=Seongchinamella sediminis TaxID=2283635 RepID=A0A3L7DTQ2_9GAMM|nr:YkgJ family cysteine cluster protein [Seongchinamella sediminis]RLQ20466.1 YkgJ family cysteine cluster protein [Seongchinamella sediminis]